MKIDPTQNRNQHCKAYVERDFANAIKRYQFEKGIDSMSEAMRELMLVGLVEARVVEL